MQGYDYGVEVVIWERDPRGALRALFEAHHADRSLEAFVRAATVAGYQIESMWRQRRL